MTAAIGPFAMTCERCGKEILATYSSRRRFCSGLCQTLTWRKNNPERARATLLARLRRYKGKRTSATTAWREKQRHTKPWMRLLEASKARASKYGMDHDLTVEWCKENWSGRCAISKLPFDMSYGNGKPGPRMFAPSIDRIDSARGYTIENCRFVLVAVNALKHAGTDADLLRIARAIAENFSLPSTVRIDRTTRQGVTTEPLHPHVE